MNDINNTLTSPVCNFGLTIKNFRHMTIATELNEVNVPFALLNSVDGFILLITDMFVITGI